MDDKVREWFDGWGKVNIRMKESQAEYSFHQGECVNEIQEVMEESPVKESIENLDNHRQDLRDTLREYGAWDSDELDNHDRNKERVVWIAAGDISERPDDYPVVRKKA